MERIAMSQEERDWLHWLKLVRDGEMTQRQAAECMKVSDRWVRELLSRYQRVGDQAVVHGLRGRVSNRRIGEGIQRKALRLLRQPDWHDFGPTFASEQLAKRKIQVSKETVRAWMMAEGLWESHPRTVKEMHEWRPRRGAYGELVQWDTSTHDWLEGRGEPVRYLVRMIDDATSRSWGRFVRSDNTRENMGVLWEYLARNGRMVDVYTDHHSMFAVTPRPKESQEQRRTTDRVAQLGRALRELGIGWIGAFSPQAKGRVERSFGTDQDRLVKLLRLAKVKSMTGANEFLEKEYWPEWNERFARPLQGVTDLHRPLTAEIDLASSLSHVESRVIDNNYTIPFAGRKYRIAREDVRAGMKRQNLRVELRLDGTLKGRYQGQPVELIECRERVSAPPATPRKPPRKDHNAGGKSDWMEGFWDHPAPPIWQAIEESNRHA
jgi:hypothetical protein